jgi:hypothetical protein
VPLAVFFFSLAAPWRELIIVKSTWQVARASRSLSLFLKDLNTLEWLHSFLAEILIPQRPTIVHEDNDAAMKIAQGLSFNATSLHIVVRYSRVRKVDPEQLVQFQYVPTRSQLKICRSLILRAIYLFY